VQPNYKRALFFLLVCALALPYFGFVIYYGSQFTGPAPVWFTDTLLVWFALNFCIAMFVGKRLFRSQVPDPEKARAAEGQSATIASRLVVLWSVLFIFGVLQTIQGKIPLDRAIPQESSYHSSLRFSDGGPTAANAVSSSETAGALARELP
jgi:peptidoglycan/LPS O-acetylase OafA/YrhL